MKYWQHITCLLGCLLLASTLQCQSLPKTGWSKMYITNVGHIDIPPTMKQADNPENIFQNFGLNTDIIFQAKSADPRVAILIATDIAEPGEYETLYFNESEYTPEVLDIMNEEIKRYYIELFSLMDMHLIQWFPLKLVRVGGMPCLLIQYTRRLGNQPLTMSKTYLFFNNDRYHKVKIVYEMREEEKWKQICDEIINTFTITNVR